jgi:glycosyltransferase involved in cell wall biosynthesis
VVNVVAIPTLECVTYLPTMIPSLLADPAVDRLVIMDNGHGPEGQQLIQSFSDPGRYFHVDTRGLTLHAQWNWAWDWVGSGPETNLCLLNDDLILPDNLVSHLAAALDADPDLWLVCPDYTRTHAEGIDGPRLEYVRGSYRHGGAVGWAFMFRTGLRQSHGLPPFDEEYRWWFGDDEHFYQIMERGGRLGVLRGLPLEHPHETTARNHEWTMVAREQDKQRWFEQRGERVG